MEYLAWTKDQDSSWASQSHSKETTQEDDITPKKDGNTSSHAREIEVIIS